METADLIDGKPGEIEAILLRVSVPGVVVAAGFRYCDQVEQRARPAPGNAALAQRGETGVLPVFAQREQSF